jgi:glucose/arabinose dehydrogenase
MRYAFAAALIVPALAFAQAPTLTLQNFVSGLSAPIEIVNANDYSGRLFVVEQAGRIRIVRNGQVVSAPFLDIRTTVTCSGGEQGLLGLAFHPNYASNGRFYVYYTRTISGGCTGSELVVERYNRSASNPDLADPASGSIVLTFPHPQQGNHNAGKLAFGPDGYLYVAIGDGGGGGDPFCAAESLADLRGKILRIDVDSASPYAIPPTNPFASAGGSTRGEIWAYGLRNPWRFSFDRDTGDLFIADVGQNLYEEVDFQAAGSAGGQNYGWSAFEGFHAYPRSPACANSGPYTSPILEYGHDSNGGFSITGGYRYRGGARPALQGYYLYGDYVSGRIWAASPNEAGAWSATQVATFPNISTFGEDENGELYVANLSAGTISRVTPAATTIPRLVNISTRMQVGTGENVLIGGFIVGGNAPKNVVVRARGPSLAAAGVTNPLANPTLQLVRSSDQVVIAANDDWQTAPNAASITANGFAPSDANESAILVTLNPGAYTAIVQGVGGGTGVGLVEVFEVDHPERDLLNISTRGHVSTGQDVMIGGLIIQGTGSQTVVIRARGPSLAAAGISNFLANPVLQLVRADGVTIAVNDDWQTGPYASAVAASGFAPDDAREAAILVTLPFGAYTAIVYGAGGGTGVGLVEVFAQ